MGLDMYAYTAPAELVGDQQVDLGDKLFADGKPLEGVDTDFAYWRKFNHLHGWMEELYRKKGGARETFNCATVRLTLEDLTELHSAASDKTLTATEGFFFGAQEPFDDDCQFTVLDFVQKARMAIDEGKAVVYDSWW
jgi:hypothetical protein